MSSGDWLVVGTSVVFYGSLLLMLICTYRVAVGRPSSPPRGELVFTTCPVCNARVAARCRARHHGLPRQRTEQPVSDKTCPCGDARCLHFDGGYPWCRPCEEHHRPPECAINEEGQSLASCGCPWDDGPELVVHDGKCRLLRDEEEAERISWERLVHPSMVVSPDGFVKMSLNTNLGTFAGGESFNLRWNHTHLDGG